MVVQRGTHGVDGEVMVAHPEIWQRIAGFMRDGVVPELPDYLAMPAVPYDRP